jgi:hypothetical protein
MGKKEKEKVSETISKCPKNEMEINKVGHNREVVKRAVLLVS